MTKYKLTIMPQGISVYAPAGSNLLDVLRENGILVNAVCGGNGSCGKCGVTIGGEEKLACATHLDRDTVITLPSCEKRDVAAHEGFALAFDIGTTGVAGYLIGSDGVVSAVSVLNPQVSYGADVVSRIQAAAKGKLCAQTELIRGCINELALSLCADTSDIRVVSVVGNPAMQQIFLGMPVDNLIDIPYAPRIRSALTLGAAEYIPCLENAELRTMPDPSAYVGADTVACVLAEGIAASDKLTLLVDIGTNGEIVLGCGDRLLCCSTAAGPALEGAGISCGMRGEAGAVDRVLWEDGALRCHVIEGAPARGICGSGLVDAVAALLYAKLIDRRGKLYSGSCELCPDVVLTQEDIRAFQLAKGAIAAGVQVLMQEYGACADDIDTVLLAGAFGSAIDPVSACHTGLLPNCLLPKIRAVGNAAGKGAILLAQSEKYLEASEKTVRCMRNVELADTPAFRRLFAKNMYF